MSERPARVRFANRRRRRHMGHTISSARYTSTNIPRIERGMTAPKRLRTSATWGRAEPMETTMNKAMVMALALGVTMLASSAIADGVDARSAQYGRDGGGYHDRDDDRWNRDRDDRNDRNRGDRATDRAGATGTASSRASGSGLAATVRTAACLVATDRTRCYRIRSGSSRPGAVCGSRRPAASSCASSIGVAAVVGTERSCP